MAKWPRQPRDGGLANLARTSPLANNRYNVQLRDSSGNWHTAFYMVGSGQSTGLVRAETVVQRLNDIFDNYPGADLDFITPGYVNGYYVVLWSGTQWFQNGDYFDTLEGGGRTYENLYSGCHNTGSGYKYASRNNVHIIATITDDDVEEYGVPAWELALDWANGIRDYVNGWNCTQDATGGSLYGNGKILRLPKPTKSYTGSSFSKLASFYGNGEPQPNYATAAGIFHTCDLTIAIPGDEDWDMNMWIRLSYGTGSNRKSVVVRTADSNPNYNRIDMTSGGTAYALNCYGLYNVTVERP